MKQQVLKLVMRFRVIIISLFVLVLLGYSLWQLMQISRPRVDEAYIQQHQGNSENLKLEIKDSLKKQIEQLQPTPVNVQPSPGNQPDPFSP
jgi:type VI protein secretion system component VasK